MTNDIRSIFEKKIKPARFNRTIGLFGATTTGVGALLGAGIYVLIGPAAGIAGPSVILTYLLCGLLAFATTLMYAELSRLISRSGGGYTYAHEILGSVGGFTTGWFLALGSLFASGLYAIGFAEYTLSLITPHASPYVARSAAIGITLLIAFLNIRYSGNTRYNLQNWIVWGNVGILSLLIGASFFHLDPGRVRPVFPYGFHGTLAAVSLIYISFFGYQLIANNADEIINPEKTIPRAMILSMIISTVIYVLVAAAAVMSVSWKELAGSPAPLAMIADKSLGGLGWTVIAIGGILASLGALSSTLISLSRQIYAMGQDRFFPDTFGELDEKTRQPRSALLAGAGLIGVILVLCDLKTIARAANFSLLVSLLPVSLAMRKFYLQNLAKHSIVLWKRYLPEITFLINIGLLFTLDVVSLVFGQQLALAGAAIYLFYSRKRERIGKGGVTIVLEEKKPHFSIFSRNKILVPMANPQTQQALLRFSRTLLAKMGGEIVVAAVKNVPEGTSFYDALSNAQETLGIIERSVELARLEKIRIKPILRASREIGQGIIDIAWEEKCDLIIMGFSKTSRHEKTGILCKVLRSALTDVVVLNLKMDPKQIKIDRTGIYVHDLKHLHLMLMCAAAIAERRSGKIVIFGFLPPGYSRKQKEKLDKNILTSLQNLKSMALYEVRLAVSNNFEADIIQMSSTLDVLILGIGQTKNPEVSVPFKISRQAACSVLLVKTTSRLKKLSRNI